MAYLFVKCSVTWNWKFITCNIAWNHL